MKVLVTGASGFIGSALLPRLRAAGHEPVALGRDPGVGGIAWDMRSEPAPRLPADIGAVVHLAQSRAYRAFPGDAPEMFAVNVAATHSLLDAAVAAGIGRFCLVSSGSVYEPYAMPLVEDASLAPAGFLGASKLAGEIVARPYQKLLSLSILRLFFPYGPGQTARLIPELIRRVKAGEAVDVSADGEGLRITPTHVADICDVIAAAVEAPWNGTYNVASPETLSIAAIARSLAAAVGCDARLNAKLPPATPILPDLTRLAQIYDLASMRSFAASVGELVRHA